MRFVPPAMGDCNSIGSIREREPHSVSVMKTCFAMTIRLRGPQWQNAKESVPHGPPLNGLTQDEQLQKKLSVRSFVSFYQIRSRLL